MPSMIVALEPSGDPARAMDACGLLVLAYDTGAANGGEIDWDDVSTALAAAETAVPGVRPAMEAGLARVEAGTAPDGADDVMLKYAGDVPDAVWAATLLVHAFRHEGNVRWEDVDEAYGVALQAVNAPRPPLTEDGAKLLRRFGVMLKDDARGEALGLRLMRVEEGDVFAIAPEEASADPSAAAVANALASGLRPAAADADGLTWLQRQLVSRLGRRALLPPHGVADGDDRLLERIEAEGHQFLRELMFALDAPAAVDEPRRILAEVYVEGLYSDLANPDMGRLQAQTRIRDSGDKLLNYLWSEIGSRSAGAADPVATAGEVVEAAIGDLEKVRDAYVARPTPSP